MGECGRDGVLWTWKNKLVEAVEGKVDICVEEEGKSGLWSGCVRKKER